MSVNLGRVFQWTFIGAALLLLVSCSGGSTSSTSQVTTTNPNGQLQMMISDDSSEDWAVIGVKVLSISLTPQGGGSAVQVYTAPTPAPMINLVQLDQLSEILGNVAIPAGTYTKATVTISGDPADVLLTVSANPETGFALQAGSTVPSSQIQVQGANSGTVAVKVNFVQPLVVTAGQSNVLDLEFDLSHPAFLVEHTPASGTTYWALNFKGPLRHHLIPALASVLLRHIYGTVTAVATDNSAITVTRDFPVEPPTTPETEVTTAQSLNIMADSTNGTILYDVDAHTATTVKDFSSVSSTIGGKFVRVAARYQPGGNLVAVRLWVSSTFNDVWVSPEGHVLHVDTSTDTLTVQNEDGKPVQVSVDANTEFFFRTPANALADATPIGTGTAFLANLARGFKVHVSVDDPLASTFVAQTIDIEQARYNGVISASNDTDFTYTRTFGTASDDYTVTLPYISSDTPNGKDASGNSISGFKWWDFTYPTVIDSGTGAISDFVSATDGSVSFGSGIAALKPWGSTWAKWGDSDNTSGWRAPWVVLEPTPMPLATVTTAWATTTNGGTVGVGIPTGTNSVTVSLSSVADSATLVYQVNRTGGIVTITPQDITTSTGLTNISAALSATGAPVKVYGVPQPDGTVKAYVVFYFTGNLPPAS